MLNYNWISCKVVDFIPFVIRGYSIINEWKFKNKEMTKNGINFKITGLVVLGLFVLSAAFVLKTRQNALSVDAGNDISSQYAKMEV